MAAAVVATPLLDTSCLHSNVQVVRKVCKSTLCIHLSNVLVHRNVDIVILPWTFPSFAFATWALAEQPYSTESVSLCPLGSLYTVAACHCLSMEMEVVLKMRMTPKALVYILCASVNSCCSHQPTFRDTSVVLDILLPVAMHGLC